MGQANMMFGFVILVHTLLFMTNTAIHDMNPDSQFMNPNGSMISTFQSGDINNPVLDTSTYVGDLPQGAGTVSPTTGNIFTDGWRAVTGWLTQTPGINILYGMFAAPYNVLKLMTPPLPAEFTFAIGSLWYLLATVAIVVFIRGGQ